MRLEKGHQAVLELEEDMTVLLMGRGSCVELSSVGHSMEQLG